MSDPTKAQRAEAFLIGFAQGIAGAIIGAALCYGIPAGIHFCIRLIEAGWNNS